MQNFYQLIWRTRQISPRMTPLLDCYKGDNHVSRVCCAGRLWKSLTSSMMRFPLNIGFLSKEVDCFAARSVDLSRFDSKNGKLPSLLKVSIKMIIVRFSWWSYCAGCVSVVHVFMSESSTVGGAYRHDQSAGSLMTLSAFSRSRPSFLVLSCLGR